MNDLRNAALAKTAKRKPETEQNERDAETVQPKFKRRNGSEFEPNSFLNVEGGIS